jgi:tRNA U38,U39,U40 pseudouridine synthase TruA
MVGALYNIGRGQISIEELKEHLTDLSKVPRCKLRAPPEGLFLKNVTFDFGCLDVAPSLDKLII